MDRTGRSFLGIDEVAEELGVSPSLIRKLERVGFLEPAERVGSGSKASAVAAVE